MDELGAWVTAETLLSPRTTVSLRPWGLDLVVFQWLPVFPGAVFARGCRRRLRPYSLQGQPFHYGLGVWIWLYFRRRAAPRDSVPFRICLLSRDKAGWVVSPRPSCQGQPFLYGLGIRWLHRGVLPWPCGVPNPTLVGS
jgi:hypothetical protein